MAPPDSLASFRLRQIRVARVSEISETTAAAPVPVEERINFHIGNPLLDPQLSTAFLRIALGLDVNRQDLQATTPESILEILGWEAADLPKLQFLLRTIQKSTPYMPRGGYSQKSPHALIGAFRAWLENQQEPLHYDFGEKSGKREVILASGGLKETLRVILWALSDYLQITPANVLCYQQEIQLPETHHSDGPPFPNLRLISLPNDERLAREMMESLFTQGSIAAGDRAKSAQSSAIYEQPTFLIVGSLLGEDTRRKLRLLATQAPLFFIEANNAPNHLSLAREAKLVQRVIRLLTPGIFAPRLDSLSPVFVVGNADFLSVIENVHFKLKGTPSASEVEFLTFLLEQDLAEIPEEADGAAAQEERRAAQEKRWAAHHEHPDAQDGLWLEGLGTGSDPAGGWGSADKAYFELAARLGARLEELVNSSARLADRSLASLEEKTGLASRIAADRWKAGGGGSKAGLPDEFSDLDSGQLLKELVTHAHDPAWREALQRSFLSVFMKHQPQYCPEACLVASGSSRTALGILGFHCGITDVVIPDLSWSYEQCFPNVHVVPLTETPAADYAVQPPLDGLTLDVERIIAKVESLCVADPHWPERGAVAINNPHNATGRIFAEESVRKLIAYCLERHIYVIDDLAYQNVAPVEGLPEIQTARQIASGLVYTGALGEEHLERLITVHSMSKTDCLAGARLAVVEILEAGLRERFQIINTQIQPNLAAIFICYLFYRGPVEAARGYWRLRNELFYERTQALLTAVENLPSDRNPFGLEIIPPAGSMYPLLHIERLPAGLSLDWLASSLARRGIGLLPLATFARTEDGFDKGRRTFRLTLGGSDHAQALLAKTRSLLIDLNRMIAEEEARYNRKKLSLQVRPSQSSRLAERLALWEKVSSQIRHELRSERAFSKLGDLPQLDSRFLREEFLKTYLPERLEVFRTRYLERASISDELMQRAHQEVGGWLGERLEREFMKDSLARRQELFRYRSYDRTVHPTQKYSLLAEMAFDDIQGKLVAFQPVAPAQIEKAGREVLQEFLGRNVSISSQQEADEILLDFNALVAGEDFTGLFTGAQCSTFLSFWSDWDGSNRPSGQGHHLIAMIVMENVARMARLLNLLLQVDPQIEIDPGLSTELEGLPRQRERFTRLLNDITQLTHQLEQRYRGILPFSVEAKPLQRLAIRLHLGRDPVRVLWQHNDRYEQKMLELRRQRRTMLETYFALNKALRKQLYALIPAIQSNHSVENLLREVVGFHDLLQRIVITPLIHEGMITARDPFAINTTVYNIQEINSIAGKYGNPGMTLGLQISLSTQPEALIALDRRLGIQAEQVRRERQEAPQPKAAVAQPLAGAQPSIWLIPLFEDIEAVNGIPAYLDRIWDYANQSRRTDQPPQSRFGEIIAEIFIAGSDLSQQIGQAHGAFQYLKAKYHLQTWLAEHGLAEAVRIKFGSGEPMQRQGGYYSLGKDAAGTDAAVSGQPAFPQFKSHKKRFAAYLPQAAQKSTAYAVTPLQGVFLGGDLRTFQSSLSEQLRYLPVGELANLLYHVREAQQAHRSNLVRAAETIAESRLGAQSRSVQELERLTIGVSEPVYTGFLQELTDNFRYILYGHPEDVFGIHIISYFIGRSMPQLRDRPTSRRRPAAGADRGQQILANIAEIIPLAKQGSLLRAIAHNQAQTSVLGINQLTTGLFRALDYYAQKTFREAEQESMIAERILPQLPVYEILHTLRIYQDCKGEFIKRVETAFPAGNSAFVALREDDDAMHRFLPLFQQELLRRHGLNVGDFFTDGVFIQELLPTLRPDLSVLLQRDLFNTDPERMLAYANGAQDAGWRLSVSQLLELPEKIRYWRSIIWEVMGDSIYQRVQSFTELASALYHFSATRSFGASLAPARGTKIPSALAGYIRTARVDDEMRQFLVGAVEYLSSFTEGSIEVPVSIIRALNDVERIAQIEETALPPAKQEVLRCAVLQIARLTGENG
jgi:aspartate/methionine/tyrosine aminotransferase